MKANDSLSFLDLPCEIREAIYAEVIPSENKMARLTNRSWNAKDTRAYNANIALLQTCRQVHIEVARIMYHELESTTIMYNTEKTLIESTNGTIEYMTDRIRVFPLRPTFYAEFIKHFTFMVECGNCDDSKQIFRPLRRYSPEVHNVWRLILEFSRHVQATFKHLQTIRVNILLHGYPEQALSRFGLVWSDLLRTRPGESLEQHIERIQGCLKRFSAMFGVKIPPQLMVDFTLCGDRFCCDPGDIPEFNNFYEALANARRGRGKGKEILGSSTVLQDLRSVGACGC